jgi:hypothetical protein
MIKIYLFGLLYLTFIYTNPQPNILPDHPAYTHYAYSFSSHEKKIIIHYAQKAKNNLNTYVWPVNTKSPKVNNFFRTLNLKHYDSQYNKAVLYLLNLVPNLLDSSNGEC